MKKNYIWIFAAVAAVGYFVYRKMNFAKNLLFRLSDIKPDGNLTNPQLVISFFVNNPSNQKATINAVSGTLYLDQREISVVNTNNVQIIAPRTESIIKIVAKPSIFGIYRLIEIENKKRFFLFFDF